MTSDELAAAFRERYVEAAIDIAKTMGVKLLDSTIPSKDEMLGAAIAVYEMQEAEPKHYAWFVATVLQLYPDGVDTSNPENATCSPENIRWTKSLSAKAVNCFKKWFYEERERRQTMQRAAALDIAHCVHKVKSMTMIDWIRNECGDPAFKAEMLLHEASKGMKLTSQDRNSIRNGCKAVKYAPGYEMSLLGNLQSELLNKTVGEFDKPAWARD